VIGRDTIIGKGWQIQLMPGKSWGGVSQCAPADHLAVDCQLGYTHWWERRLPDQAEPAFLNGSAPTLVGQVRPNVSSVRVRLSNGTVVRLRPVEAYGRRWIGLVLPDGLSVAMVTVYTGGSVRGVELAHSVPWRGEFYSWLPPGDPGPRPVTKAINRAVVPWATRGRCGCRWFVVPGSGSSQSKSSRIRASCCGERMTRQVIGGRVASGRQIRLLACNAWLASRCGASGIWLACACGERGHGRPAVPVRCRGGGQSGRLPARV